VAIICAVLINAFLKACVEREIWRRHNLAGRNQAMVYSSLQQPLTPDILLFHYLSDSSPISFCNTLLCYLICISYINKKSICNNESCQGIHTRCIVNPSRWMRGVTVLVIHYLLYHSFCRLCSLSRIKHELQSAKSSTGMYLLPPPVSCLSGKTDAQVAELH
jgi:hypothetical protein